MDTIVSATTAHEQQHGTYTKLDQSSAIGEVEGLVLVRLAIKPDVIWKWLEILKLRKANAEENTSEVLGTSNKQFLMEQIQWISITLAIGLGISIVVPFPFSLLSLIGAFMWFGFYVRKRALRKVGMSGAPLFGGNSSSLNYYCMSCGNKHNEAACPRCACFLPLSENRRWQCEL